MNFTDLFNLQIMMFSLMGVGYVLGKLKMISKEGKRDLTDLIINVVLPCNIISSFLVEFSTEIVTKGFEIFILSCLVELVSTMLALTIYKRVPKRKRMILQYGTICSNAGFLGNPVAEGVYGPMGLLYGSIYLIPQRIIMWSVGVSFFAGSSDWKSVVKKVALHPCVIAVYIGIFFFATQIPVPVFFDKTVDSLGRCTTALTMLMIGTILADADMKTMVTKTTLGFSALRLVILPLLALIGCYVAHVTPLLAGLTVLLVSMPAGSTTVILAVKYGGDEEFAIKCVVLTTLLSMIMIPVWCMIVNYVMPI